MIRKKRRKKHSLKKIQYQLSIFEGIRCFAISTARVSSHHCSISEIHPENELRFFNFYRIFSAKYSYKHDNTISHMFLSSFVCMECIFS